MMQPAAGVMAPQPMRMDPHQQQWMMITQQQQQQQQPQTRNPPQQSQMGPLAAGVWPPQPQPHPQGQLPAGPPSRPVMATQPYPHQTLAQPQQIQQQQQQPQQAPAADESKTLWIGELQYWMDESYLYGCFAVTGEVISVKVVRNKHTGQSEGYSFVEFASHSAAERALHEYSKIQMPNTEQYFRVNWATSGSGERLPDSGPDYSIFVGDLAADVTDYKLQETFQVRYSSVKGARVVIDKISGRSKGYGFVQFGDENEQLRAITEMNGVFCSSRPIRTGPAAARRSPPWYTNQQYNTKAGASQASVVDNDPNNATLFVGGLDPTVTEDTLRQEFSRYGELSHVKILVGKRCGFVQFSIRACAEEALKSLHGTVLGQQAIRLSWGRTPTNKQHAGWVQPQQSDPDQGNGAYHPHGQVYDAGYEYSAQPQDPNISNLHPMDMETIHNSKN